LDISLDDAENEPSPWLVNAYYFPNLRKFIERLQEKR
jgi:hypothetical protein